MIADSWLLTIVLDCAWEVLQYINKSHYLHAYNVPLRAVGHWTYGSTYREQIVEQVRRAAEHCDCLQCFFLIHSMGGGESYNPTTTTTTTTPLQHTNASVKLYLSVKSWAPHCSVVRESWPAKPFTSVGWLCRHGLRPGHICPEAPWRGVPRGVPHRNLSLPLGWGRRHHLALQ